MYMALDIQTAVKVLKKAGVNPDTRVRDLTDDEVSKIREAIDETTYNSRR